MISAVRRTSAWYWFVAPAALLFAAFTLYPIVLALFTSVQVGKLGGERRLGLENYAALLTDPVFGRVLVTSGVFVVATVSLGLLATMLVSALLFRLPRRPRRMMLSALYLPTVAPAAAVALMWGWMYAPVWGLLNFLLSAVGVEPVQWVADPQIALPSVITMVVVTSQGASILILLAAMESVPPDYGEAARVDGASAWQEYRHVTFPLVRPALLFLLVIHTISAFTLFAPIYLLTGGGPNRATTTLGYLVYSQAFESFDFGRASAAAVVLLAIVAVVASLQFRWLSSNVEY